MDIYNLDNGKTYTLRMIDRTTGNDWAVDWVGDLTHTGIHYNEGAERYEARNNEIDWWICQMGAHQAAYDQIAECRQAYGADAVDDVLSKLEHCDFEQQPDQVLEALETRFGIVRPIKLF
jgi:hypothetical protein